MLVISYHSVTVIKVGLGPSCTFYVSTKPSVCLAHELEMYTDNGGIMEKAGSVSVWIELKTIPLPNIVDYRRDVSSLQAALQTSSIDRLENFENSQVIQSIGTGQSVLAELGGFSTLKSLCGRLKKIDLEAVKPVIEVIDALSQVSHISISCY